MKKLPWSTDEYVKLEPADLDPSKPPTAEQRVRVAAALATVIRDGNMLDRRLTPNAESIRCILTMDAESWKGAIVQLRDLVREYDPVDGSVRFNQTVAAS